jgi:phosphoribosylglycinamide formyltransferase-1
MNIAVFCSGNGSNLQAILDAEKNGLIPYRVKLMVCDNQGAYAIKRARNAGIPCLIANRKDFASKEAMEERIAVEVDKKDIGLICLAGYMRLLSARFVERYAGRIINVHPALLPAFKGKTAIKDAFDSGVKVSGVTIHFVTEDVDSGPVILQEAVTIEKSDTLKMLTEKIHMVEHRLYPRAIRLLAEGKLNTEDNGALRDRPGRVNDKN